MEEKKKRSNSESMVIERPIAFFAELSRTLGNDPAAAIYYQQLHYWREKGGRDDGYIYKSKLDIEQETTLSRKTQDRVRKKLVRLGWLEVKLMKAKGAPTLHYKPLMDISLTVKPDKSKSPKGTNGKVPKGPMEKPQRDDSLTETTPDVPPYPRQAGDVDKKKRRDGKNPRSQGTNPRSLARKAKAEKSKAWADAVSACSRGCQDGVVLDAETAAYCACVAPIIRRREPD